MLHIVNTPVPWPHYWDQGRPYLTHVAWFDKSELPADLARNTELGCFVIHDAAGYLCAPEDEQELASILVEQAKQPGYARKRLTGEEPEALRQERLERLRRKQRPGAGPEPKSDPGPQVTLDDLEL